MASSPTYDPNLIDEPDGYAKILRRPRAPCSPSAPLLNRATRASTRPGSTFKIVTAAAALDIGQASRRTRASTTPATASSTARRSTTRATPTRTAPRRSATCTLATALRALDQRRLLQHRQEARARGRSSTTRSGSASTRCRRSRRPSDERAGERPLRPDGKLFDPKDPDNAVDPGRLAFGQERMLVTPLQMAMVAAGDRERRRRDAAATSSRRSSRPTAASSRAARRADARQRAIKPETAPRLTAT